MTGSRTRMTLAAAALLPVATGLFLALSPADAQGLFSHDNNAPVNYAADRIELQDRQNRVVLSGNVDITQGDLQLKAARTTVAYSNSGNVRINRIDATGGVTVTRGNEFASGNAGVYDFGSNVITLAGNVQLRRGGDTLNGGRLVIDLNTGRSSVDGSSMGGGQTGSSSGGRVTGSFSVPDRD
jgi:lipopolysaccharide export system protein LptA